MEDQAKEIRLRAERRAGELLREMEKNKGAATRSSDATALERPKLADLGITKQQASDWQRLAAIPKPEFEIALGQRRDDERASSFRMGQGKQKRSLSSSSDGGK
jgi:hypothetical protein